MEGTVSGNILGRVIVGFINYDEFARADWYSTPIGENVLVRHDGAWFRYAVLHREGVYTVKVPSAAVKTDDDSITDFAKNLVKNPEIDFELPSLKGLSIKFLDRILKQTLEFEAQAINGEIMS